MGKRFLGSTTFPIPALALGTWAMGGGESWGYSDEKSSARTLLRAAEIGFNYVDTAPAYGNGYCEELIGRVLEGVRDRYIVASKCGLVWGPDDEGAVHKQRGGGYGQGGHRLVRS